MSDNIVWKYIKELRNPESVDSFLKKNKIRIPKKLIECIKNNNGGRPDKKDFSTNKRDGYVFKSLLSFNENDKESIFSFYPDLFRGTNLFPFGLDSAGNFICYDMRKKKYVLWNHETDEIEIIIIPS